jgi:hypothetical protein
MQNTKTMNCAWMLFGILAVLSICLSHPIQMQAQCSGSTGNPAVYAKCGTGGTIGIQGSSAYIDASVIPGTGAKTDVCARINAVLQSSTVTYPTAGAVIDARGVGSGTTQVCSISPWGGTAPTGGWRPATILLPSGVIVIPAGWTLPNETRIIGENAGPRSGTTDGVTTIQACVTGTTGCSANLSGTLITMGSSVAAYNCPSTGCIGVGVQDLWLDGNGLSVNGISNTFSEDLSYVKHVNLYQIVGTGMGLSGTSQNSGPYTDIGFSLGSSTAAAGTTCAHILSVSTRGIHGLTCTGNTSGSGTIPTSAVVLDTSNSSIEDVEIQGFGNGILVGENASAQNDVLLNIRGGTNVSKVIAIANVSGNTVSDISVIAASNGGNTSSTTIQDNRTSPASSITASTVAIYVLGNPIDASGTAFGYTRFTTAIGQPTWAVGSSTPSPTTGCTVGSLYSNTSGSGTGTSINTWYVCTPKSSNKCSSSASCWTPIG